MKKIIVALAGMMFFASVMTAAAVEISFNGAIDVDMTYSDGDSYTTDSKSDLNTVTVDFGADAKLSDKASATILLTNGDNGIEVDTATINYSLDSVDLTVGTQTVPFGRFNTNFISDTEGNVKEIAEDSIVAAFGTDAVNVSVFAYAGSFEDGDTKQIDDLGIDVAFAPAEGVEVGASYATNADGSDDVLAVGTDVVDMYSVYASGAFGAVGVSAEYVAVDGGDAGSVYDVELSYSLSETSVVAVSYAAGDDGFVGNKEVALDNRYGIVYSTELEEGLGLAAEYLHYKADDVAGTEDDYVTVELSIAF